MKTKATHTRGPVRCITTGQTFESAAAAAHATHATPGAMSNHLAGRAATLGGKRFERVTNET